MKLHTALLSILTCACLSFALPSCEAMWTVLGGALGGGAGAVIAGPPGAVVGGGGGAMAGNQYGKNQARAQAPDLPIFLAPEPFVPLWIKLVLGALGLWWALKFLAKRYRENMLAMLGSIVRLRVSAAIKHGLIASGTKHTPKRKPKGA